VERHHAKRESKRAGADSLRDARRSPRLPAGMTAPQTVDRLRRVVGNAALTRTIAEHREVRGRSARPLLQRLGPAAGSDPTLAAQYAAMAATQEFQDLDVAVTTNTDITLDDSSIPGPNLGPVDYNSATHTIRVPVSQNGVARPLPMVRDDLLWEMHNARNRGSLGRGLAAMPAAPGSAEEKRTYKQRVAATALAIEWDEWMRVVEHNERTTQINNQLGAGYLNPGFAGQFAAVGQGWYLFREYMAAHGNWSHRQLRPGRRPRTGMGGSGDSPDVRQQAIAGHHREGTSGLAQRKTDVRQERQQQPIQDVSPQIARSDVRSDV
jgi:hypothetical protein